MFIALLIILGVILQGAMMGVSYPYVLSLNKKRCKRCTAIVRGSRDWRKCSLDHESVAFFASVGWPIGITYILASNVVNNKIDDVSKDDKRRQKEIEEAKHQKELARIRFEEDQYLTKQLGR